MIEPKLYAVLRHNGQWGISVRGTAFLPCHSFQEALEVATSAAAILRSAHAKDSDTLAVKSFAGNTVLAMPLGHGPDPRDHQHMMIDGSGTRGASPVPPPDFSNAARSR